MRRSLLAALVLALLWPAVLAPAHWHTPAGQIPGPAVGSGHTLMRDHGAPRLAADTDGCVLCRELLGVAAYLLPPGSWLLAADAPGLPLLFAAAPVAFSLRTPAPWHSRAPPRHLSD